MNTLQVAKQIRKLIRDLTWDSGGANKVFHPGGVMVTNGPADEVTAQLPMPYCLILPGAGQADPIKNDEPELIEEDYMLRVVTAVASDPTGEGVMLGRNQQAIDQAEGRGIFEIQEKVLVRLARTTRQDGIRIQVINAGTTQGGPVQGNRYVAARDYTVRATTTLASSYEPATNLQAVDSATPGAADVSWELPPDRFDYRRQVLRRLTGSTPPADPADGTGVTLGGSPDGAGVTSVTDSPGAGTYSYALWTSYDDFEAGADTTFEASGSVTVVIA